MKLGLSKNFVKIMDKNTAGSHYLKEKFTHVSEPKLKERIFVDTQLRSLINDGKLEDPFKLHGKVSVKSFEKCCSKFFRKS